MSGNEDWEDALITTIRAGDVEEVRQALDSGEKLETYSAYGETPLGVAAGMGHLEIMRLLLKRGVNPDEDDYEGYTAIEQALMRNEFDAIDLLLDWGTPEAQNRRAVAALLSAAEHCNLSLVYRLIDRGVDINGADDHERTALIAAVQARPYSMMDAKQKAKRRQIIRLLLERGANVHKRYDVHRLDRGILTAAHTAMFHATCYNDRETVDLLRQAGAEITLTEAAAVGDEEAVRRLLDAGQDPDWRDVSGETALCCAAEKGHAPVVRLLLERGANAYALSGQEGWIQTALAAAACAGHNAAASVLLQATLNIHLNMPPAEIGERLRGTDGRAKLLELYLGPEGEASESGGCREWMPLMEAVYNDNAAMINLLLGAGCDVNVGNDADYTALMVACECGATATVRLLLEAGADPNRCNTQGNTALICAIAPGADDNLRHSGYSGEKVQAMQANIRAIVLLLINAGADVNVQSDYCRTPLEYAAELGRDEIAGLLRAAGAISREESA